MFIDRIPNRRSPPAVLLRESFRRDGKSRKRTLANLSKLPEHVRDRRLSQRRDNWRFRSHPRSRPCGSCPRQPAQLRARPRRSPQRDLVMAAARLPSSKTARRFAPATSTLAGELGLPENIDENHEAMDWLVECQNSMSPCREGALVLYDLTSTWSYRCPLVRHGYSPRRQERAAAIGAIVTGGRWQSRLSKAADPSTVAAQVEKLRRRFRLSRVVLVGGMLTDAREDLKPGGLDQRSACARDPGLG